METNKVPAALEHKLTTAIEKAATLAAVSEELDRDTLLADSLREAGIEPKFAKVASSAFNKRLTVLTFQKTADEHKADAFALSDGDKVYELLGGVSQTKRASVVRPAFKIDFADVAPAITKTASVSTYKRQNYEDRVNADVYQRHIESVLDKQAARVSEITGMCESMESHIKVRKEELAKYFAKSACESFEFNTLKNVFGARFERAMKDVLPVTTNFGKTASAAILPAGGVYDKVAKLLTDIDDLGTVKAFLGYYGQGLQEFCKTAAAFGNTITKAQYDGLLKEGVDAKTLLMGANALANAVTATGATAMNSAEALGGEVSDTAINALTNARNLYNAGNSVSLAPNAILDADFLVNDRYKDRMLSWSDMTADPQFAMYPAEQVFAATQKAMDADTTLERPDRREVLRTQVAQLLAQNNRYSSADVAALATMLRGLADSSGSAADMAAASAGKLDKETAPDPVDLKDIGVDRNRTKIDTGRNLTYVDFVSKEMDRKKERVADRAYTEDIKLEGRDYAERQKAEADLKAEQHKQEADRIKAEERLTSQRMREFERIMKEKHLTHENGIFRNGNQLYSAADIRNMINDYTRARNDAIAMS